MATESDHDIAQRHFRDGVRHFEAGELEAADSSFAAALAIEPTRTSAAVRLASTRLRRGLATDAISLLATVLQADPSNVDALGVQAAALATLGYFPPALEAVDRIIAVQPRHAQAWTMRGNLLRELGRMEDAAECFARAVEDSRTPEVMSFYAAATGAGEPPPTAPRAYVKELFDTYAPTYDSELVDTLNYRAPQILVEGVSALGRHFERALDLGCGTGLCAPLLHPLANAIEGVDLAPKMVDVARARGLYAALHVGDIEEFLRASQEQWDLVIAADVFIYVGRLDGVFAALAPCMPAGGICCFSVEAHDGPEPLVLQPTRRYAHSQAYVEELARSNGFRVLRLERAALRDQRSQPIVGLCAWLERNGD